jgi:hypothetical protein
VDTGDAFFALTGDGEAEELAGGGFGWWRLNGS